MSKIKQKINQGNLPAMSLESFLSSVKKAKQLEQERDEVKAAQQQKNGYRQEVQILKSLEGFKQINDFCQESFSNAKLSKEQQRIVNEFLALRLKSQKDTQYNPKSFLQARLLSV